MREIAFPPKSHNGEVTVMRGQFSQLGGVAPVIPKENIPEIFRIHGVPGDPIFPEIDGDYTKIRFSSESVRAQAPTASQLAMNAKSTAALSSGEKSKLIENFIEIEYSDMNFNPQQLKMMVDAAKANPTTVDKAMQAYEKGNLTLALPRTITPEIRLALNSNARTTSNELTLASKPAIENELASRGENRYFAFTPAGSSSTVPARVLDIHIDSQTGAHVYAEWMTESSGGNRVREVGMISLDELKTISKLGTGDRLKAATAFYDSLTPNELTAQMLARKLRLEPRGYTDFMRAPGMEAQHAHLITEKMSNLGHQSIRSEVEQRFGKLDDLLTEAEKKNANWNVIDVFGRLSPEYVLQKYRTKDGFKYMFVVTEDGQLKISPLGKADTNLRPQLLRLGHGRKIYSSGTFTLDQNGAAQITRRSADYSSFDAAMAGGRSENQAEDHLIDAVFRMQSGTKTSTFDSVGPDTWGEVRFNEHSGLYEDANKGTQTAGSASFQKNNGANRSAAGGSPFHEYGSAEANEYMQSILNRRSTNQKIVPDWDRTSRSASPPTFLDWKKRAGIESGDGFEQAKIDYAHHVLGTNGNQTFQQIRETYRKLQSTFYSRDGSDANATASQLINDAFKVFKDKEVK